MGEFDISTHFWKAGRKWQDRGAVSGNAGREGAPQEVNWAGPPTRILAFRCLLGCLNLVMSQTEFAIFLPLLYPSHHCGHPHWPPFSPPPSGHPLLWSVSQRMPPLTTQTKAQPLMFIPQNPLHRDTNHFTVSIHAPISVFPPDHGILETISFLTVISKWSTCLAHPRH